MLPKWTGDDSVTKSKGCSCRSELGSIHVFKKLAKKKKKKPPLIYCTQSVRQYGFDFSTDSYFRFRKALFLILLCLSQMLDFLFKLWSFQVSYNVNIANYIFQRQFVTVNTCSTYSIQTINQTDELWMELNKWIHAWHDVLQHSQHPMLTLTLPWKWFKHASEFHRGYFVWSSRHSKWGLMIRIH